MTPKDCPMNDKKKLLTILANSCQEKIRILKENCLDCPYCNRGAAYRIALKNIMENLGIMDKEKK